MQQQTWVTILAVAGFVVALAGLYLAIRRDLRTEFVKVDSKIDGVRTELKTQIGRLETQIADSRSDLKTDIGRLDGRLVALETRLYDIAIRLPAPAAAQPTAS